MATTQHHAPGEQDCKRDDVFVWRRSQLVRLGFSELLATSVAHDGRYDLHELMGLVEDGCPPDLALRILAPLDDGGAS